MAGQSIFFRTLSSLHNGGKMILSNRVTHVNFTPSCKGLKQDSKEFKNLKLPEKPKKPLTSFFNFMVEKRPLITKENPSLSSQDVLKKISEEWKFLSTEAREKYELKAKEDKSIYEKNMQIYMENLKPEQESIIKEIKREKSEDRKKRRLKKELKEELKPKRPATPFGYFVRDCNKDGTRGEKSVSEFLSELKGKWAKLSEAEKNKYKLEYEKNKDQYEKEMAIWERKMLAEGKENLIRVKTLKEYLPKHKSGKVTKPE